jgi:hypothetical protein
MTYHVKQLEDVVSFSIVLTGELSFDFVFAQIGVIKLEVDEIALVLPLVLEVGQLASGLFFEVADDSAHLRTMVTREGFGRQ